MFIKYFVVCLFSISVTAVMKNYDSYKVYSVTLRNYVDVEVVKDIEMKYVGEIWEEGFSVGDSVKIMVAPERQSRFLEFMQAAEIPVTEVIGDLQRSIDEQKSPAKIRTTESLLSMHWHEYHDLQQIYNWLDELAATYPGVVSTVVMGKSVEDRDIKGIVINYKHNQAQTRPRIGMLEGTLHAREWISAATVTWIIKEFLTSTDPEIRALAENFEWHIFPVVNPDGYVYTFTTNRMWRKNRSTASFKDCAVGVDNDMSNGVDLNRNFDFMWMVTGASNDSCTNTYAGPFPASEPETKAIAEYTMKLNSNGEFIYYYAFHSYTQLFIIPYSHLNSSADPNRPSNYGDMFEIAQRGRQAIFDSSGMNYRVGLSADVLYPMSGGSFDWVKYNTNVPVCYLIELRDLGEFGFLLEKEQIIPNAKEIVVALLEMDKNTREIGIYRVNT